MDFLSDHGYFACIKPLVLIKMFGVLFFYDAQVEAGSGSLFPALTSVVVLLLLARLSGGHRPLLIPT